MKNKKLLLAITSVFTVMSIGLCGCSEDKDSISETMNSVDGISDRLYPEVVTSPVELYQAQLKILKMLYESNCNGDDYDEYHNIINENLDLIEAENNSLKGSINI